MLTERRSLSLCLGVPSMFHHFITLVLDMMLTVLRKNAIKQCSGTRLIAKIIQHAFLTLSEIFMVQTAHFLLHVSM